MGGFTWEGFESTEVFQALNKLTRQPTGSFIVQDALEQIQNLLLAEIEANRDRLPSIANNGKPELTGILPDCVADVLVELACRTEPRNQDRLAEFASQLYKRTELDPKSNEPVTQDGRVVWSDDMLLRRSAGHTWGERLGASGMETASGWGGVWGIHSRADDLGLEEEKKQRWVNLVAFTARLTSAAEPPGPHSPLSFEHIALWSLRAAFEGNIQPHEIIGTTTLRVACLWFSYAADALWYFVKNDIQTERDFFSRPGSQYKEEEWKGFNYERWDVWVHALEQAQTVCTESDRETIEMIQDALAKAKSVTRVQISAKD